MVEIAGIVTELELSKAELSGADSADLFPSDPGQNDSNWALSRFSLASLCP